MNVSPDNPEHIPGLDLDRHHEPIQEELMDAIRGVIRRNDYVLGKEHDRFERKFAEFCGVREARGVASGTDAIQLALEAAGIGKGDEVITTPITFFASVEAILHTGAEPVFVDIDPETFCMDPDEVRDAVTEKTAALLPVHLFGHPADMDALLDLVETEDLTLIEDACQAHGAEWEGNRVGSMGDAGCFSFYPAKNMGAFGEAGIITTDDPELAERIRRLRNHGENEKRYHHGDIGYNSRLDNIQAAVLDVKLNYLTKWNRQRTHVASCYSDAFSELDALTTPVVHSSARPVWHQYALQVPNRDQIFQIMSSKGIGVRRIYPKPLHMQEAILDRYGESGDFPRAESFCKNVLNLPIFPEMSEPEQRRVIETTRETIRDVL